MHDHRPDRCPEPPHPPILSGRRPYVSWRHTCPRRMRTCVRSMRDRRPIQACYRCGELKPAEEFAWRRKAHSQRDSFCRPCRAAYKQEHYAANRQRYIDKAGARKRELALQRTRFLIEFFKVNPCVDCGERDPVILEFDHLRDKSFAIGTALSGRNWDSILREIAKCEVVCANCHRRRTAQRRGALRAILTGPGEGPQYEAGDRT